MNAAIAEFCAAVYTTLLPFAWLSVLVVVVVILPMSVFRIARPSAGRLLLYASYVIGATTWFLGATVTFATWGWIALIVGLLLGGFGVVPIGALAALISLGDVPLGISIVVMVIIVFSARLGALALMASGPAGEAEH